MKFTGKPKPCERAVEGPEFRSELLGQLQVRSVVGTLAAQFESHRDDPVPVRVQAMVGDGEPRGGLPRLTDVVGRQQTARDQTGQTACHLVRQEGWRVDVLAGRDPLPDVRLGRILPRIATRQHHQHIGVEDDWH